MQLHWSKLCLDVLRDGELNQRKSLRICSEIDLLTRPRAPLLRTKTRAISLGSQNASRTFTNTSIFFKKGGKAAFLKQEATTADDPHDFSTLEAGIQKALNKLQDDLSKLRTGGRFNPELLERVPVRLEKDNKQTYNLGLLAQVIPKGGRSVAVLVGQADVSNHFNRSGFNG
jgi:Ribosome recycling factor